MATPLFSIITITFNNRKGLSATAKSVLAQTHQDFEWMIIDGASTDHTQDDFIHYARAHIISEKDSGIYDAMNKGIDHATGEYVIFMNAGDAFADEHVLENITPHTLQQPDFIYGDSLEEGHLKAARHHSKIIWGMPTHHQAMFYNRRTLADRRYDLSYKIAADYDLTLRFLKTAQSIIYVPIPICIFETGGASQINVKLGRDEQFQSRLKHQNCSFIKNQAIRLGQIIRYEIRKRFPKLYWRSMEKDRLNA